MEYVAGGELFDHLVAKGRLRSHEARSYFRQIIFGVDYCHRFNICHRDLKPENLLLDGTKRIVKVADFGMAALQPVERMLETSCGSPHYASPEIVSGKSYKGSASDIWSCGIILFALLCGRLPFDDQNIARLLHKVRDGRFEMPDALEPAAKDLIWRMLEVDPEKRMKMPDIMRHPWFTNNGLESATNPSGPGAAMLGTEVQLRESEIDHEILKNLKSLWPEHSTRSIVRSLTTPGSSWQKTFYSLLVQHRDNHAMDDEEEEDSEDDMEEVMAVQQAQAYKEDSAVSASQVGGPGSLGLSLGIVPQQKKPAASIKIQEQPRPSRTPEPSSTSAASGTMRAPQASIKPPLLRASTDNHTSSPRGRQPPATPSRTSSSTATPTRPSPTRARSHEPPRSPAGPRGPAPPSPNPETRANRTSMDMHSRVAAYQRAPSATAAPPTSSAGAVNLSRRLTSPIQRAPTEERTIVAPQATMAPPTSSAAAVAATSASSARRLRPVSINAPSIAVPQVGDATVQKFFQEIAAELASIRAASPPMVHHPLPDASQSGSQGRRRSSQDVNRSSIGATLAATLGSSQGPTGTGNSHHVRLAPSPVVPAPPTPELITSQYYGDIFNQFDDAEEENNAAVDHADRSSVRSSFLGSDVFGSGAPPYTPTSPVPPTAPSPVTRPLSISDKPGNRLSLRVAPSSYNAGSASRPVSPAPSAGSSSAGASRAPPSSYKFDNASTSNGSKVSSTGTSPQVKQGGFLGKRRSLLGLRSKSSASTATQSSTATENTAPESSRRVSVNYDQKPAEPMTPLQARLAQNAAATAAGPSRLQQRNPGLGLDLTTPMRNNGNQYLTPASPGAASSLASPTLPNYTAPPTPTMSSHASAGPKQSWFAGLFNWKAVSYHLSSHEGFVATQVEVRRLLLSLGAGSKCFIEDSEALGAWRCSMKDSNGKTLRFKIEFNIASAANGGNSQYGASPALSIPGTPHSTGGRSGMYSATASPVLSSQSRATSGADSFVSNGTTVYSTKISFTLEKGNGQAFKVMFANLKRCWSLDYAAQSPAM